MGLVKQNLYTGRGGLLASLRASTCLNCFRGEQPQWLPSYRSSMFFSSGWAWHNPLHMNLNISRSQLWLALLKSTELYWFYYQLQDWIIASAHLMLKIYPTPSSVNWMQNTQCIFSCLFCFFSFLFGKMLLLFCILKHYSLIGRANGREDGKGVCLYFTLHWPIMFKIYYAVYLMLCSEQLNAEVLCNTDNFLTQFKFKPFISSEKADHKTIVALGE